jgi:hypothetical protein
MTTPASSQALRRASRPAVVALLLVLAGSGCSSYSTSPPSRDSGPRSDRHVASDRTAPFVVAIKRRTQSPTNARSVSWVVVFDEAVRGVRARNFRLVQSGLTGRPSVTRVSGSRKSWRVTASTGSGSPRSGRAGSLRLDLRKRTGITNLAGKVLARRFRGQTYAVDKFTPAPSLTSTPADPSTDATSHFSWSDEEAGDTSLCSFEDGPFTTDCSSPYIYVVRRTDGGTHRFAVEAVDALGNVSSPTSYSWRVEQGSAQRFTIDGNALGMLFPGASPTAIAVTLHNPNDIPIFVTSVAIAMRAGDFPSGCNSSHFVLAQAELPAGGVRVPASSGVTLPAKGARAPTVQMTDSGDQSPCRDLHFHLEFSGTAHS